jgi:hypothetical protein
LTAFYVFFVVPKDDGISDYGRAVYNSQAAWETRGCQVFSDSDGESLLAGAWSWSENRPSGPEMGSVVGITFQKRRFTQMSVDYLSCPNCGEPISGGELCNLQCRREWEEKQQARAAKHARMGELVHHLFYIAPEPIVLDGLGD